MAPKIPYIRIEPRDVYDRAIVKEDKDGQLTYSYWLLIDCVMEEHEYKDIDIDDAIDWVEYNILSWGGFKVSYNRKYAR